MQVSFYIIEYAAYLATEDVNFISVDWERMAAAPRYFFASANVKRVGEQTGQMIQYLIEQGSYLNRFHLIGFSLGAHAAGTAGSTLNGSIPRITGRPTHTNFPNTKLCSTVYSLTWMKIKQDWTQRVLVSNQMNIEN